MTIATTTSRVDYTGNGATTAFAVPFPFFGTDELEVIERVTATGVETTKALTTDYSVTGGDGSTGTVTAVTAPASTVTWTIRRVTDRTQETDYSENDAFPAASHERALDRVTAIVQEVERDVSGRALLVPATDSAIATLPNSVDRASMYLGFDAAGDPIALDAPAGTTAVTAYAATLLDDADAAAARTTLGAGSTGDAVFTAATITAALAALGLGPAPDVNLVVNGGFEVWQASNSLAISASTTATASIYAADRWCMETSANQACAVGRFTGLTTGSQYCARVQRNSGQTGTSVLRFQFPLELSEIYRLRGNVVSFAATMRAGANLAGTLRIKLLTGTGSEGRRTNAASYTGEATPLDVALSLTTTAAEVTGTSSACASNITQATLCVEWTPSGTAGAADYFEIDDARLNIGSAAVPYFARPLHDELARCQRFYEKSFPVNTTPVSNTTVYFASVGAYTAGTTVSFAGQPFKAQKRSAPTMVAYDVNSANTGSMSFVNPAGTISSNVAVTLTANEHGFNGVTTAAAAGSVAQASYVTGNWTADARL